MIIYLQICLLLVAHFSHSLSTGAIQNDKKFVENLKGLILLVPKCSFTITVCTVGVYHRVEFQTMIITCYNQICLHLAAKFLAL